MRIDWANKPDWADVWIEADECNSGWHKSGEDFGYPSWQDDKGLYYHKHETGFKVHYPPPAKNNRQQWIDIVAGLTPAQIYDALASGELESPKSE